MRSVTIMVMLAAAMLAAACGGAERTGSAPGASDPEASSAHAETAKGPPALEVVAGRALDALAALPEHGPGELAAVVHPKEGITFAPYAYIDEDHRRLLPEELEPAWRSGEIARWGAYDGRGDPIDLSFTDYVDRFVWDRDYREAEPNVGGVRGRGNTISNIDEVFPGSRVVEYYVPAREHELDWRALRLVFEEYEGELRLVAVVHDEWTI